VSREIPELDRKGLRKFAWIFATLVAGLFGLILPLLFKQNWPWEPWLIAVVLFAWGLIAPSTLRFFYRLWMRFGFVMNAVVTTIVLAAVFFFAILPFGLAFRLLGKDLIHKKWNHQLNSYRTESTRTDPTHMEKPF
jgi:hypothetical protein